MHLSVCVNLYVHDLRYLGEEAFINFFFCQNINSIFFVNVVRVMC